MALFRFEQFQRILIALSFGSLRLRAEDGSLEGKRILDVRFSPAPTLAAADLAEAMPLRVGEPLRGVDVASAIDRLFATGRFEDIRVEAEPAAEGVHL